MQWGHGVPCVRGILFLLHNKKMIFFFFSKGSFTKDLHYLWRKVYEDLLADSGSFQYIQHFTETRFSVVLWNSALKTVSSWMPRNLFLHHVGCWGARIIHQQDSRDCPSTWTRVLKTVQATGSPDTWIHNGQVSSDWSCWNHSVHKVLSQQVPRCCR